MTQRIGFYSVNGPFGAFSNFSAHPFELEGRRWPTSEHYFQAQKFAGTEHEEALRQLPTPMAVAKAGRERSRPLRADWEEVKEEVMLAALRAKFHAHPELESLLLSTGHAELVEEAQGDAYWGWGPDGQGLNRLGALLMQLRSELRAAKA